MRGQHSIPLGAAEVSARGEVQSGDEGSEYAPSGRYVGVYVIIWQAHIMFSVPLATSSVGKL